MRIALGTWILLLYCFSESTSRVVQQRRLQVGSNDDQCELGFIGSCTNDFPAPVLPIDHWLHNRTNTALAVETKTVPLISEWWWTTGVLKSEQGDEFGIEVLSAGFYNDTALSPVWPLTGFNQISVSDVENKKYFQTTAETSILPLDWATYDSNQPWAINHPGDSNGQGQVTMLQVGNWNENEPLSIEVKTTFIDEITEIVTTIDLTMTQREGKQPLYVNGDGLVCSNPILENPMDQYNFYYSLTYLDTYGTITIGDEKHAVSGLMWQDHQYGFFSLEFIKWVLQNLQLDNGVHLTNFFVLDPVTSENPEANVTRKSQITILDTNGESYCAEAYTTPRGGKISNTDYFREFEVTTDAMGGCNWTIISAFDEQYFTTVGKTIFEGVAHLSGSCGNEPSTGTAWLEQALFEPTDVPPSLTPSMLSERPTPHPAAPSRSPTNKGKTSKSLKHKGKNDKLKKKSKESKSLKQKGRKGRPKRKYKAK